MESKYSAAEKRILALELDSSIHKKLKAFSVQNDSSMSEVARRLIISYLKNDEGKAV